ncbi:MAG: hypothetical protein GQ535_16420 [Rhodobacteraceae bacterium]|nr:hypothetical protein [Paracoccaceae bacterium]
MLEGEINPDCTSTEADMLALGLTPLSAEALAAKIVGKTVYGDFGYMFKYVMTVDSDGRLEGKNNASAHTFGHWVINPETGEMSVAWQAGWVASTTRVYEVGGSLKLYETSTGRWATSLHRLEDGTKRPLSV